VQTEWLWTFVHWASAMGIQSAAPYCNVWFFNYTSDQQDDRCNQGAWSALAMSNLSPKPAAAVYKQLGDWVNKLSSPAIASQNGVVNGASFQGGISSGSWAVIRGDDRQLLRPITVKAESRKATSFADQGTSA
jgi:hypothetical protein